MKIVEIVSEFLPHYDSAVQVGIGGYVWLPTGSDSAGSFVGASSSVSKEGRAVLP